MKNMNMSKIMSEMMNGGKNQKISPEEIMQEMCGKMENKPWELCMKIEKSLDELIKINQEILKEMKTEK